MDRDRLILGLAAVFTGLSVLLVVLSFVYSLFLLIVAVPFGATAYFMWYHASGRMEARTRARARGARRASDGGLGAGEGARGGFSAQARQARARANAREGRGFGAAGAAGAGQAGQRRYAPSTTQGPTPEEAYRTLDLDPGADTDAVRSAYREKVKQVHPDTDSGSEEAFKEVNRAYETLTE
ncbi:J domain-containing protein [Salinirubrum litoreum]|uniref:J domain-containing protein n=1 Tax=Salinirubrum litoreum TaxID=1126234 RepID=A0ABD5RB06_9EURY